MYTHRYYITVQITDDNTDVVVNEDGSVVVDVKAEGTAVQIWFTTQEKDIPIGVSVISVAACTEGEYKCYFYPQSLLPLRPL